MRARSASVYRDTGPVAAIVVDADPPALARFWATASGWAPVDETATRLRSANGTGPFLEFVEVGEAKAVKARVHLDVAPRATDDHASEVARLEAAGARRIDIGQGEVTWVVMSDPEGNEFCVLRPR